MRGIISCAMAAEIARLTGYDAFDAVYGTSAGALIGSFFVTRQMHLGPSVFIDDLTSGHFIRWRNALRRHPVVDLSYLMDEVLVNSKPLVYEKLAASLVPLKVVAASLTSARSRLLSDFQSREELWKALRASATIPFLAGPPIPYRGDLLFDGGLFEPLPYESAIGDGCTHVLLLTSRPKGKHCRAPSALERRWIEPRLRRFSPETADTFHDIAARYRRDLDHIEWATDLPSKAPYLCGLQLARHHREIGRLQRSRDRLIAGAAGAAQVVRMALQIPALQAA